MVRTRAADSGGCVGGCGQFRRWGQHTATSAAPCLLPPTPGTLCPSQGGCLLCRTETDSHVRVHTLTPLLCAALLAMCCPPHPPTTARLVGALQPHAPHYLGGNHHRDWPAELARRGRAARYPVHQCHPWLVSPNRPAAAPDPGAPRSTHPSSNTLALGPGPGCFQPAAASAAAAAGASHNLPPKHRTPYHPVAGSWEPHWGPPMRRQHTARAFARLLLLYASAQPRIAAAACPPPGPP